MLNLHSTGGLLGAAIAALQKNLPKWVIYRGQAGKGPQVEKFAVFAKGETE